jgi:predicted Rossmann fold flavoprotein
MEHASNKSIAIIGAGAAGCLCAYFLSNSACHTNTNPHTTQGDNINITLFDKGSPLRTLLPTGGGRCNLAHAEYDFRELAKNYPRGEKFLYSVFSRFGTAETLETFEQMGINCYTQENGRIFPKSNSAKEVRETILNKISKANIIKEEVINLTKIENGFKLKTNKAEYLFSDVILAIGGHSGYELAKRLNIKTINPKPSLVGLNTKEDFKDLSGTVVKGALCNGSIGDLLFTHFGISGPLIYTISSIKAFDEMPYKLTIDLCPSLTDLQEELNKNPHKEIKNILNKFLPQKVVSYILKDLDETTKSHKINGKTRDLILERIHNFEIEVIGTNKGEETVTAGGIDLDEINPKTMETKNISNLYAIGEVLNIDGFCGGFNLQNAWSTAYVCAENFK